MDHQFTLVLSRLKFQNMMLKFHCNKYIQSLLSAGRDKGLYVTMYQL